MPAPSAGIESRSGRRLWLAGLLLLLLINLGLRLVRLPADSPSLPGYFRNVSPYKDEGEKAFEARNRVLFGQWQTHPADNFRFWQVQSPVWTSTLVLVFETLGVSYASLRLVSIFSALVILLAASLLLRRAGYPLGAVFLPLILGLNLYFLVYTRLGLMEPMMLAWLSLCALFLAASPARPLNFIWASIFFLAAVFTKQSALLFAPVWAGYGLWLLFSKRQTGMVIAGALIVMAPILLALLNPDFRALVDMNFRHGFHVTEEEEMTTAAGRLALIAGSFSLENLGQGFFLALPSASLFGIAWMISMLRRAAKRREVKFFEWMLLIWFLLGRLAAIATPHQVVRFHLFYFIPLSLLAALSLDWLWNATPFAPWKKIAGRGLVVAALLYELAMTAVPWARWVENPRYDLFDASRRLGEVLAEEEKAQGRTPVVIGEWAGPLSLENRMLLYYVKGPFNQSREQLAAFGITHLLESTNRYDPAVGRFTKLFPETYAQKQKVAEFKVRGRELVLWRIPRVSLPMAPAP